MRSISFEHTQDICDKELGLIPGVTWKVTCSSQTLDNVSLMTMIQDNMPKIQEELNQLSETNTHTAKGSIEETDVIYSASRQYQYSACAAG